MGIRGGSVALLVLLALGACGEEGQGADSESPEPTATVDVLAACGLVFDGSPSVFERIPPALTGIGGQVSQEQSGELLAIRSSLEEAIQIADAPLGAALSTLKVPFEQFADVVDAGGGDLTLDSSQVMTSSAAVMQECVAAGYSIEP